MYSCGIGFSKSSVISKSCVPCLAPDSSFTDQSINLSSFENFKMDVLRSTQKDQAYVPDDTTILKMFNDAKSNKINNVIHRSNNTIIVSAIIIVITIILFLTHWFLIRKIGRALNTS